MEDRKLRLRNFTEIFGNGNYFSDPTPLVNCVSASNRCCYEIWIGEGLGGQMKGKELKEETCIY